MTRRSDLETIAILLLLILARCSGERCKKAERQALLDFKAGLYNTSQDDGAPVRALSSWGQESDKRECCEWLGVECNTNSGHVFRIDLSQLATFNEPYGFLAGKNLSSSLVDLPCLTHLDLSNIDFYEQPSIPGFLGSLGNLRYLNLSYTGMTGEVPPQLGNLSSLEILDLSDNSSTKKISNLGWLSNLLSLLSLDLSCIDMSMADDWVNVVSGLPNLSELRLRYSDLPFTVFPSSLPVNASRNLIFLEFSGPNLYSSSIYPWLFNYNATLVHLTLREQYYLRGSIPKFFGDMAALEYLDLSDNLFEGYIPENLGNMSALEYLKLSGNLIDGEIPESIWQSCSLRSFNAYDNNLTGHFRFPESTSDCAYSPLEDLDLSNNRIQGSLPNLTLHPLLISLQLRSNQLEGIVSESLGQLSNLVLLDLAENVIEAVLTEAHFLNLSQLRYLDLSSNSHILLNFSTDWIPSFQLEAILIRSCKLGPHFPRWLRNQKSYSLMDISDSGISDSIPNWFWSFPKSVSNLNLSNNQLSETSKDGDTWLNISYFNLHTFTVDLSSNRLKGSMPYFLLNMGSLLIARNNFSDINSLCTKTTSLEFFDISFNQISGELPDCWQNAPNLFVLILSHNNLSGRIPNSFGFLPIRALYLSNNKFIGRIPESLKNCSELVVLDAGENSLSGQVPAWMGTSFFKLTILSLRSNKFNGSIPSQLCHLTYLQILDLSLNDLTSTIPRCVGNFEAMKVQKYVMESDVEDIFLLWKGEVRRFINLDMLRSIDFSSNKLDGEIPKEITNLTELISLNLSRNFLNGKIPRDIGNLTSLDVLDLSNNNLSSSIPLSLGKVDRLNTLDLSNNNLSGKIPTGPQLQNRDSSAYSRNPGLCGEPLSKKCDSKDGLMSTQSTQDHARHEDDNEFITKGFYISTTLGFIAGFGGTFWSLILKLKNRRR